MQKQKDVILNSYQSYPKTIHFRKDFSQAETAKQLGISKSYLSMILSGQRKCPAELVEKLQSIPGIHKVVNSQLWDMSYTQEVRGSNPLPPTIPNLTTAIQTKIVAS
jgi:transcriptional regulator with XRE-family HTH domain